MKKALVTGVIAILTILSPLMGNTRFFTYLVNKGDTFWGLSRKFKVPLKRIYSVNNIADPDAYVLKYGTTIRIPYPLKGGEKEKDASTKEAADTKTKTNEHDTRYAGADVIPESPEDDAAKTPDAKSEEKTVYKPKKAGRDSLAGIGHTPTTTGEPDFSLGDVEGGSTHPTTKPDTPTTPKTDVLEDGPHSNLPTSKTNAPVPTKTPSTPDDVVTESLPMTEAPAETAPLPPPVRMFSWPYKGNVVKGYGVYDMTLNSGIDIAGTPEATIRVAKAGRVTYVGKMRGYGNVIIVKHDATFNTVYARLGEVHVRKGDVLKDSDIIGRFATQGYDEKPVIHFKVFAKGRFLNPFDYLKETAKN